MHPISDIDLGAAGWVLPPVVRRGEPVCPGREAGRRTSGGGRSIGDFSLATQRKVTRQAAYRRRNPVEGNALVSCTAKPCHLGSRYAAMQRCYRPPHPNPLPQGERGRLPWCNALRLLHPTAHPQGRGDGYRGRLRFANRPYSTQFDTIRSESTLPIASSIPRAWGHGHSPSG